jgi:hypothetical protein
MHWITPTFIFLKRVRARADQNLAFIIKIPGYGVLTRKMGHSLLFDLDPQPPMARLKRHAQKGGSGWHGGFDFSITCRY